MKIFLRFAPLCMAALISFGCAHNYYNVPSATYEKKVRTLGVAPIFVDADSSIRHPEKDALIAIVKEFNRKNEKALVTELKGIEAYSSVRLLDDDTDQLFTKLFFRRERRDDGGILYNKYFFKTQYLQELIKQNNVDAVMLVVVSGLTKRDKIYSSNITSFLESDYDYLIVTSQVLDGESDTPLWEYPNFRQRILSFPTLYGLQYPDFDEAAANLDERVNVKYKTIPGIRRGFDKKDKDILMRTLPVSSIYNKIFEDMSALQKPERGLFGGNKDNNGKESAAKPDK